MLRGWFERVGAITPIATHVNSQMVAKISFLLYFRNGVKLKTSMKHADFFAASLAIELSIRNLCVRRLKLNYHYDKMAPARSRIKMPVVYKLCCQSGDYTEYFFGNICTNTHLNSLVLRFIYEL